MSPPQTGSLPLGELLDSIFSIYRKYFLLLVSLSALPYICAAPVFLLFLISFPPGPAPRAGPPTIPSAGQIGAIFGLVFLGVAAVLVASTVSIAATSFAVWEIRLGRVINLKTAYRAVFRHLGKLIGAYFLAGVAFLCGYILLIIPGILIVMALSLTGLVVIVEDLAPMAAIQRSRDLTRGYRWRIFVSWIITSAISGAMAYILLIPVFVLIPLVLRHGAIPAWFTVVSSWRK